MSSAGVRRPTDSSSSLPWRSPSLSKKKAPASVSLVFAEPEQGAPLESATTKLPAHPKMRRRDSASTLRSLIAEDRKETCSIMEEPEPVEQVMSEGPLAGTKSAPDILVTAQGDGIADAGVWTAESSVSAATPEPIQPPMTDDAPIPIETLEILPPKSSPAKSSSKGSPSGSSWFASLARSAAKERKPQTVLLDTDKSHDATAQSATAPPSPRPMASPSPAKNTDIDPQRSTPQQIPPNPQRQSTRAWFSSPSSSSPLSSSHRPSLSPTTPNSPTKSCTSVDEEVPQLNVSTPCNSPHPPSVIHQNAANGDGKVSMSSLNPSSSRFTLGIPLLGKAKVPLDQVVASMAAEVDKDNGKAQGVAASETSSETLETESPKTAREPVNTKSSETISTDSRSTNPPPPTTEETQRPEETRPHKVAPSSSSWWSYVGWSSTSLPASTATPSTGDASPSVENERPSAGDAPLSSFEESPTNTIRAVKSAPHLATQSIGLPSPPPGETKALDTPSVTPAGSELTAPKPKAQSVFSDGTVQSQGSTAWYIPWNWYNSTSGDAIVKPETPLAENEGKTESELVKEEALARDQTPIIQVSTPSPPSTEPSNPIESGISANKSGWASFFSSTSLLVKNIKDVEKRDENGMEVMDIDDDDTPASGAVSSTNGKAADVSRTKSTFDGKPDIKQDSTRKDTSGGKESKDGKPTKPPAPPLTNSNSARREMAKAAKKPSRDASPSPSTKSRTPTSPKLPNLVLPTWNDTFHAVPRSIVPPAPTSTISKTLNYVSGVLFQGDSIKGKDKAKGKAKHRDKELESFGRELPKAFDVLGKELEPDVLQGCSRAVIIGIHGWFPGAVIKTVVGEPTGTSGKFVDMMLQALDAFQDKHDVRFRKITRIPLEGEGTISKRVEKLYKNLLGNKDWMADLHAADVIFVATHSQGSVVSTHLMDRLIRDGHIRTSRNIETSVPGSSQSLASGSADIAPVTLKPQRLCCLALCGIHLGPLRYLSTSSLLQPYFQYFESAAARELFEFQDTESEVSKQYVKALANVLHHKTKMVYVASLNDQVVPVYSGLFTTASHPLILRAMYIDGDAYQSSDFLSNLLVLLLRAMNSGISDSGLLAHLSEATAGSLNGVGHSTAYEELATYSLAVDYCFLTTDGTEVLPELVVESFDAKSEQNDYEIPWALRDVIADERVAYFFSNEIIALKDAFRDWHPKTTVLREIKRKLQPIQRLPSSIVKAGTGSGSVSKL